MDRTLESQGFEAGDGLFVFDAEPVLDWPVTVAYPVAGGEVRKRQIDMQLQYLPANELTKLVQRVHAMPLEAVGGPEDPLLAVVHGWSGIAQRGVAGEVPCTDETKARVLKNAHIRGGVINALMAMCTAAAAKNSETPAGNGQGPNRKARRAASKTKKSGTS